MVDTGFERAKNGKDEWLTPPEIIEALGEFDLDPCAPIMRPWDTAKKHYTKIEDGLERAWEGRVWCNPPYGTQAVKWLKKLSDHRNGIALIFARTETNNFFNYVWYKANAIMFLKGRITFYNVDGTKPAHSAGSPSCLIAYGKYNAEILKKCKLVGKFLYL